MRLYSRAGAAAHDHPGYPRFEADSDGGFDFPDDVADELRSFHVRKSPMWETEIERAARRASEEEARMRDPATLAALVAELVKGQSPPPAAPAPAPAKAKATADK